RWHRHRNEQEHPGDQTRLRSPQTLPRTSRDRGLVRVVHIDHHSPFHPQAATLSHGTAPDLPREEGLGARVSSHIGIVGVSPEGAALFYRQVTRQAARLLPPNEQPRISVHNEPLEAYISAIRKDDWHAVGRLLRRSAELLGRCGAEFCLTPDNAVQHGVQL